MAGILNKVSHRLLGFQPLLSKVDGGLLLLLVMPWLLLLVNENWIFTPTVTIDPWVNFGYFNNLGQFIKEFAGTYYGTRLPWIIPGYICYKVFPPLVANYVLHVGFYYIAIISLYYILKQTTSSRAALLTSILMGCYPFFLGAIGWDYIDGAGITYFLLTMLLLTLAAKNRHKPAWTISIQRHEQTVRTISAKISIRSALILSLAGASLALFIYTNTFLIIFVPLMALYYIIVNRQYRRDSLATSLLFVVLGFAALTMLLGAVNMVAGGNFLFFLPSFSYALQTLGQPNPWKAAGYSWLEQATWLVFPSLVFLSSLLSLLHSRLKKTASLKILLFQSPGVFTLCYMLMFLIMVLLELSGMALLELTYYASYLMPAMFLAIGEQISPLLVRVSGRKFCWLAGSLIVFLLVPYYPSFRSLFASQLSIFYPTVIIILGILTVMLLRLLPKFINAKSMVLLFLFLGAVNFTIIGSHLQVDFVTDHWRPKQAFLAIAESDAIIRRFDRSVDLRFWYSSSEPLGPVYCAVASTRLWGYRLINDSFPILEDSPIAHNVQGVAQINPNTRIVILSSDENAFEMANAAFEQFGQHAELLLEEKVEQGSIKFTMTFIEVKENE